MLFKSLAATVIPALALAQGNYTVTVDPTVTEVVGCSTSSSYDANGVLAAVLTIDITSTITLCGCENDTIAATPVPATAAVITSSPVAAPVVSSSPVAAVPATPAGSEVASVSSVAPTTVAPVAASPAASSDVVTYVTIVEGQLVTVYGSLASSTAPAVAAASSNGTGAIQPEVEASGAESKLQVNLVAAAGVAVVIAGGLLM